MSHLSPLSKLAVATCCASFAFVAPLAVADSSEGSEVSDSAVSVATGDEPTPPPPVELPKDPTSGPCAYTPTPDDKHVVFKGLPDDPEPTPGEGMVPVVLLTNKGNVYMWLNRKQAPCTVQSIMHLAKKDYYDDTICHRLTAYDTLKVLQCGDPLGTGWGGPGYSFKDELPTNLKPWEGHKDPTRQVYPRGTLAMANAGPNTNGSQFFLTYEDSALPPKYSIFGCVSPYGMYVLDKIAKKGVAEDSEREQDGAPAEEVKINHVYVGPERAGSCPKL